MQTVYDVRNLLKKFGVIVYTGDRKGDDLMMEMEILELYKMGFIDGGTMKKAVMIVRSNSK